MYCSHKGNDYVHSPVSRGSFFILRFPRLLHRYPKVSVSGGDRDISRYRTYFSCRSPRSACSWGAGVGVLGQVILVGEKRPDTAQLEDALAAVHDGQFIATHKFMASFLKRGAITGAVAAGVRCVVHINGFLAKCSRKFLEGCVLRPAQKDLAVHVANDGVGVVLIQRFELRLCLQHQAGRNFPAADGGHQLFQVRDLPDVGALVDQTAHMDGQSPAIHVICFLAEQVEELGVNHGNQEVEGAVCFGHDEEQRRFPVSQGVQFKLVIGGNLPQFGNVEGSQPGTAGNEDRLRGLATD